MPTLSNNVSPKLKQKNTGILEISASNSYAPLDVADLNSTPSAQFHAWNDKKSWESRRQDG